MISSIRPCNYPLCNIQMLIDDYSNAIYWRIAAIFSTIAALFSVAIVLWYLIYRQNPNTPDETDSKEKLRFFKTPKINMKHNLLSEIIDSFKSFPLKILKSTSSRSHQNFLQRFAYFLFGSYGYKKKENDLEKLDISDNTTEEGIYRIK